MGNVKEYLQKDGARSAIVTSVIVIGLIFAVGTGAAMEVQVDNFPSNNHKDNGDKVKYEVEMEMNQDDEYVPVDGIEVKIDGETASVDLSKNSEDDFLKVRSVEFNSVNNGFGYGYGYGYDADVEGNNGFGYGYGYGTESGYGYGYDADERTIVAKVTLDTSKLSLSDGEDYTVTTTALTDGGESPDEYDTTNNLQIASSGGGGGDDDEDSEEESTVVTPPQNEKPEPKKVEAQVSNGTANAEVGEVEANQTVNVSIPDVTNTSSVESISVKSSKESSNVQVSVSELDRKPEGIEDAGTDVYRYQEINVDGLEDDSISSANVSFTVSKDFVDNRSREKEDVVMKRYNDEWEELPTRYRKEVGDNYKFVANSDGFSYYAVALQDEEEEPVDDPQEGEGDGTQNETTDEPQEDPDEEQDKSGGALPWIIGLLVVLAGVGAYFREEISDFVVDLVPDEAEASQEE